MSYQKQTNPLLGSARVVISGESTKKTHCSWCGKPMSDTGSAGIHMPPDYGREVMPRCHGQPCSSLSCTYYELYGLSQTFNHTNILSSRAYQKRRQVLLERYKSLYAEFKEWYIERYGEEDFYTNQEI